MTPGFKRILLVVGALIWVGVLLAYRGPGGNRGKALRLEREGERLYRQGQVETAVGLWQQAIELAPERVFAYEKLSAHYLLRGEWQKAQSLASQGLTHSPRCVNLYFNQGLSLFQSGEFKAAADSIDRVLASDDYYPNAHYLKGLIYHALGESEQARAEFVKELNVNPANPGAWKAIQEMNHVKKK